MSRLKSDHTAPPTPRKISKSGHRTYTRRQLQSNQCAQIKRLESLRYTYFCFSYSENAPSKHFERKTLVQVSSINAKHPKVNICIPTVKFKATTSNYRVFVYGSHAILVLLPTRHLNWQNPCREDIWAMSWDMVLFVLRKLILQTRMRSHPVGPDVWFLNGPFVYYHT